MPTGKPIPNMMDIEVVDFLYTCVQATNMTINFEEVAGKLGLKDAAAALSKLQRIMRAQQKSATNLKSTPAGKPLKKADGEEAKVTNGAKKRKLDTGKDTNSSKEESIERGDTKTTGHGAGKDAEDVWRQRAFKPAKREI